MFVFEKLKEVPFWENLSEIFFSSSKPKVCYLSSFLSSLLSPKFQKQDFMYFGRKYVETEPSSSHELTIFLKYHIPLI